jgi:hypothetical protein
MCNSHLEVNIQWRKRLATLHESQRNNLPLTWTSWHRHSGCSSWNVFPRSSGSCTIWPNPIIWSSSIRMYAEMDSRIPMCKSNRTNDTIWPSYSLMSKMMLTGLMQNLTDTTLPKLCRYVCIQQCDDTIQFNATQRKVTQSDQALTEYAGSCSVIS